MLSKDIILLSLVSVNKRALERHRSHLAIIFRGGASAYARRGKCERLADPMKEEIIALTPEAFKRLKEKAGAVVISVEFTFRFCLKILAITEC